MHEGRGNAAAAAAPGACVMVSEVVVLMGMAAENGGRGDAM